MSDESQKEKHSKRRAKTESKIKNRIKFIKESKSFIAKHEKLNEPHRFAKLHPLDCGNSNCVMCRNPRKIWGKETIKEQSAKQDAIQEE